jgi:hypothetical protein
VNGWKRKPDFANLQMASGKRLKSRRLEDIFELRQQHQLSRSKTESSEWNNAFQVFALNLPITISVPALF